MVVKENIDLVLCDFRLPDAEGMDVLQKIKVMKPETAVIIITGYSDVKVAINCIRQGAVDYVTKPIHPEEILISIKKALAGDQSQTLQTPKASQSKPKTFTSGIRRPCFTQGYCFSCAGLGK